MALKLGRRFGAAVVRKGLYHTQQALTSHEHQRDAVEPWRYALLEESLYNGRAL